jgi:hypothetical protein
MTSRYLTAVKVPEKIGNLNFFGKNIFMAFVRLEIAAHIPTFWKCSGTASKKFGVSELHRRMFCELVQLVAKKTGTVTIKLAHFYNFFIV